MTWAEFFGYLIVSLIIGGIVGRIAHAIGHPALPTDPAKRAAELERRWREKRLAEGASWDEIAEERHIRMALAVMRREASEAALKAPKDYDEIIADAKSRGADYLLTVAGRPVALRFLGIARTLGRSDILYPDAMAAVDKANGWDKPFRGQLPKHHDEDRTAAFTDL